MKKGTISIPDDEWSHPEALHEWWYVNSHLKGTEGRSFGLYLFFSDYLLFSLTDKLERKIISKQKITDCKLRCSKSGIQFGPNFLAKKSGDETCYQIHYQSQDLSADLSLESKKEPLIVNGTGKIKEGLIGTSWYYALTRLKVRGHLKIGSSTQLVEGIAWLDRQWGRWEDMGIGSWIWLSLQLSNGCEALVTEIYTPFLNGVSSKVLSVKKSTGPDEHTADFKIRRVSQWSSPTTGSVYGTKWTIESSNGLNLNAEVDFEDQELHRGLWQGSCKVSGVLGGESVTGVGYAEQVDKAPGALFSLFSLSFAPYHSISQNMLGRADLGLLDLIDRLGIWKLRTTKLS